MRKKLIDIILGTVLLLILMQGCTRRTSPDQSTAESGAEAQTGPQEETRPADQLIAAAASANTADALSAYRTLEQRGSCPYLENSPETPVGMLAAAYGAADSDNTRVQDSIRLLVKLGCDIDQYNATGLTPLHNAVLFRQPELLRFLVELGADTRLRVIHVPGNKLGHSIANLDAYGLALVVQEKAPADKALAEIIRSLSAPDSDQEQH